MKAIAIIHHEGKPEIVNAVLDTELTREDLLHIISRLHNQNQRMQEDYDALLEMNRLLERQNQRLLREKFEHMREQLHYRPLLCIKSK
jgi:hypothetical protein